MHITLLRSKIHRAIVTGADLDYEGSIAIDPDLIEAAGFFLHERVEIYNVHNGERFATYVIPAPERGAGTVMLNGAAARKAQAGDPVIICAYGALPMEEAAHYVPTVVLMRKGNKVKSITPQPARRKASRNARPAASGAA